MISAIAMANYSVCASVLLVLLALSGRQIHGYVLVSPEMRSFSSVIKEGNFYGNEGERLFYKRDTGIPGVITEQWFTGQDVMDENMRIRIYVDGEKTASIDFQLLLGHGVGFTESDEMHYLPWGTRRIAHLADGGIQNSYRIPYSKSFRVTGTSSNNGSFWYIIRGVENYPLVIGDLQFPANTRLKLHKIVNQVFPMTSFVNLAVVPDSAGALYQVTLATQGSNFSYLEGCMRVFIDGEDTESLHFLSSGTEDFFLSAYYFNRGVYHMDDAGLTFTDGRSKMSAYKFFEDDPILFTKSMRLVWRCGEKLNGMDGCPSDFQYKKSEASTKPSIKTNLLVKNSNPEETVTVTAYVWVYQW